MFVSGLISLIEPHKSNQLQETLGKPLNIPSHQSPAAALPCLTQIGPASVSTEIGDTPRVALRPWTDLPSVDRPPKVSTIGHYMYILALGDIWPYLEDPG